MHLLQSRAAVGKSAWERVGRNSPKVCPCSDVLWDVCTGKMEKVDRQ